MEFFSALGAAFLFALACNLDTVGLAVGYGAGGRRLDLSTALTMGGVTTLVTFLSLWLGAAGGALFPARLTNRLGALALTALGLWYLLDALRAWGKNKAEKGEPSSAAPLALSAALAVNNAGVGVAAGVTGLSPLLASGCNFLVTLAALELGCRLGGRLERWSGLALPLSGALLVALGLWRLV